MNESNIDVLPIDYCYLKPSEFATVSEKIELMLSDRDNSLKREAQADFQIFR